MMTDETPAYILHEPYRGGYLSLRYWCDGEELIELGVPEWFASRFTRTGALIRQEFIHDDYGVDVDIVYMPELEPDQLPLPFMKRVEVEWDERVEQYAFTTVDAAECL
jgi:hypothetical protein